MSYPRWAPSPLIEFHQNYLRTGKLSAQGRVLSVGPDLSNREASEILHRLLTDTRMEKVWRSLVPRFSGGSFDYRCYRLVLECLMAVSSWRTSPKLSRRQRKVIATNIKKAATDLRKKLETFGYLGNPLTSRVLSQKPKDATLQRLNDEILSFSESPIAYQQIVISLPPMEWLLKELVADIDELAEMPLLAPKPNSKNASLHYFIRRLNRYFLYRLNQPLHDAVAIISSVALNIGDKRENTSLREQSLAIGVSDNDRAQPRK